MLDFDKRQTATATQASDAVLKLLTFKLKEFCISLNGANFYICLKSCCLKLDVVCRKDPVIFSSCDFILYPLSLK